MILEEPKKLSQLHQESQKVIIQIIRVASQRINDAQKSHTNVEKGGNADEDTEVMGHIPMRFTHSMQLIGSMKLELNHEDESLYFELLLLKHFEALRLLNKVSNFLKPFLYPGCLVAYHRLCRMSRSFAS